MATQVGAGPGLRIAKSGQVRLAMCVDFGNFGERDDMALTVAFAAMPFHERAVRQPAIDRSATQDR